MLKSLRCHGKSNRIMQAANTTACKPSLDTNTFAEWFEYILDTEESYLALIGPGSSGTLITSAPFARPAGARPAAISASYDELVSAADPLQVLAPRFRIAGASRLIQASNSSMEGAVRVVGSRGKKYEKIAIHVCASLCVVRDI